MSEELRCVLKCNWHHLSIGGDKFIAKILTEDAESDPFYVLLLGDLIDVWCETLRSKEILERNNKLNPSIDVPVGRLLSHVGRIAKSSELSIKRRSEDEMVVSSRSTLSSLSYNWEFELRKCDKRVLAEQLTFPLVAVAAELNRRNEQLIKIIEEKDAQIESFDSDDISTKGKKRFDIEAFRKQMNESHVREAQTTVANSVEITFGTELEAVFSGVNDALFQRENGEIAREEIVTSAAASQSGSSSSSEAKVDSTFAEIERRIELRRKIEAEKAKKMSNKSNKKLKL